MRQPALAILLILFSLIGILILNSAYIIDETQQAVVTQFGEPVKGPVQSPGLHWKVPFIQVVHYFDKRILEWDGYPSEVPTRDKKFIWVDVTGRWRIADPLVFLQTMRTETNAQTRLDDIIDGVTRNFITRYDLPEVVRSTNDILDVPKDAGDLSTEEGLEAIKEGRDNITRKILESAQNIVKEYGIEIVDMRIKRINYIPSVQTKVFERMISERKRAAETLRSEGQGIRAEIQGQMEKELKRITSEAYRKVQKLKGDADAEATAIYGEAYSKDPAFYAFTNSLEKYPQAFKDSRMVMTTDSDFLQYFKNAD